MNRKLAFCAIAPAIMALGGCVVIGPPYPPAYPAAPFQPQCQQGPGISGQGPTISCTRPDGSVSTTVAPPPASRPSPSPSPSPDADQGYGNQDYPPAPPPGYSGGYNYGY